jgi:hypothetical protein
MGDQPFHGAALGGAALGMNGLHFTQRLGGMQLEHYHAGSVRRKHESPIVQGCLKPAPYLPWRGRPRIAENFEIFPIERRSNVQRTHRKNASEPFPVPRVRNDVPCHKARVIIDDCYLVISQCQALPLCRPNHRHHQAMSPPFPSEASRSMINIL